MAQNQTPTPDSVHALSKSHPIVFFDGVCGLCNTAVDWLLRHDSQQKILFTPLQGKTAEVALSSELRDSLDSVIVYIDGRLYQKSDAFLHLFPVLGGVWKILSFIASGLPRFLRDFIYDFIARNRYRWFGKRDVCRLPSKEERSRFLD